MKIHTAQNYQGKLSGFLEKYDHQPDLTAKLDQVPDVPLSQETVNEIVLWKVNRYAPIPESLRVALYGLRAVKPRKHRSAKCVLLQLLGCGGVDLPMASTILRFQAPGTFQIIDRRAYRALFGTAYPLRSKSKPEDKVTEYFRYLDALHNLAKSRGTRFCDLDRILYIFDKEKNKKLRIND